ncbi:MAG: DMT family transporter [Ignavibacteria bacterium]|nr:DMT family transporter [Ignavibacteria bacterium]
MIGELSALTASVLWSISPYIFSSIVTRIGSFNLNISRLLISSFLMFFTCILLQITLSTNVNQLFFLVLSGIVGLVLGDTFLFKSLKEIGPRYTMILMSSNPAFGAIIAYFAFNEQIPLVGILGMIITFVGICLVVYQQNGKEKAKYNITHKGIIFGLLSSLGQAGGLILTKYAFFIDNIHPLSATFYRIFPSFLVLTFIGILSKRINTKLLTHLYNRKILFLLVLGSIIGPYLGITFSYIAVTNTQIGIAATLMSLQPVLMLPISRYLQKERFSIQSIVGAFLSVIGIALLFLKDLFLS